MAEPTAAERAAVVDFFTPLYANFVTKTDPQQPLLLAHYTSVQVVEQILKNDEIWFANPLYMNDLQEMRFGIATGSEIFPEFAQHAGETPDRIRLLVEHFNHYLAQLATNEALDTHVFCLCEHDLPKDENGLLSMWREYGSKGNGAALVFNTQKINYQTDHPILIAKVIYATEQQRVIHMRERLAEWARITKEARLSNSSLYLAAKAAFDFIKSFALTTKHSGFSEEKEWRAIYVPERDPHGYFKDRLDYFVGPRGVEPKFKFQLRGEPQPGDGTRQPLISSKLSDILEFILLGPSVSYPLSSQAFIRMLERIGKGEFKDRVFSSRIPLRPSLNAT